jgi:hypothetical protein
MTRPAHLGAGVSRQSSSGRRVGARRSVRSFPGVLSVLNRPLVGRISRTLSDYGDSPSWAQATGSQSRTVRRATRAGFSGPAPPDLLTRRLLPGASVGGCLDSTGVRLNS